MHWLDPDVVPTMGHFFRAAGYRTFYKGKWHISHADIAVPGTHEGLKSNDADGNLIKDIAALYEQADRLQPFGFSGWVGGEPHGADMANSGLIKDPLYQDQVNALFDQLEGSDAPWLAVASFVNPHDIVFPAPVWDALGLPNPDETLPKIPAPPSQSDSFQGRPATQEKWKDLWPAMMVPFPLDELYRGVSCSPSENINLDA
jgi:arylsulfatase A-like enzyme